MLFRTAVLLATALSLIPVAESSAAETVQGEVDPSKVSCGPNALYVFLKLHGVECDYASVLKGAVPTHAEGLSLQELTRASDRCGVPAEVRRCALNELIGRVERPLIARVESFYATGANGHYIIVLAVSDQEVTAIDPTLGVVERYPTARMGELWSGYVIVSTGARADFGVSSLATRAVAVCVPILGLSLILYRRARTQVKAV